MLVLRLTNSDDLNPAIPEHLRAPAYAAAAFEKETGEPLQTVSRVIWPSPHLPGIVDGWLGRYRPDLVLFRASSYWCTYESVPLRLQRRFGRAGGLAARTAERAGESAWFPSTPLFRAVRTIATRTIGGDPHFTAGQVVAVTEVLLRRVLASEDLIPVVRGPITAFNAGGGRAGAARAATRLAALDSGLADVCRRLHVSYVPMAGQAGASGNQTFYTSDRVHQSARGQEETGTAEGRALAAAWLAAQRPGPLRDRTNAGRSA